MKINKILFILLACSVQLSFSVSPKNVAIVKQSQKNQGVKRKRPSEKPAAPVKKRKLDLTSKVIGDYACKMAGENNVQALKALHEKGFNLGTIRNSEGFGPLHVSAQVGAWNAYNFLYFIAGVDSFLLDEHGRTAGQYMVERSFDGIDSSSDDEVNK